MGTPKINKDKFKKLIKVRRTWGFKPTTRVKQSKKIYRRKEKFEDNGVCSD